MRFRGRVIGHRRKRYYCLRCKKYHGRASTKNWWPHRKYRGKPPDKEVEHDNQSRVGEAVEEGGERVKAEG